MKKEKENENEKAKQGRGPWNNDLEPAVQTTEIGRASSWHSFSTTSIFSWTTRITQNPNIL